MPTWLTIALISARTARANNPPPNGFDFTLTGMVTGLRSNEQTPRNTGRSLPS